MQSLLAAACVVALLAGCSAAGLRPAVGAFHDVTAAAVKAQHEELDKVGKADAERIKQELAARRVAVGVSTECGDFDVPAGCRLVQGNGEPIPTPFAAENIRALGDSLLGYSASLVALAADTKSDTDAFANALGALSKSLGGLSGAVAKANDSKPIPQADLTALANIVATAGSLYFEGQRVAASRRIIIAADPILAEATATLAETDDQIRAISLADQLDVLLRAQHAQALAIRNGASVEEVRRRQEAVFTAFAAYQQRLGVSQAFVKLGEAHHKLALAAQSNASLSEIVDAISRLTEAARIIAQSTKTLTT